MLTKLIEAVMHRDISRVRELLDRGADPNEGDGIDGTTVALYYAIDLADVAMVRLLLEAGADSRGMIAFCVAADAISGDESTNQHLEIMDMLVDRWPAEAMEWWMQRAPSAPGR
jgi:hypothetical protein